LPNRLLEVRDEEVIVISTVHPTHFDTVVEVEGNTVRMTEPPRTYSSRDRSPRLHAELLYPASCIPPVR
jgi:hypothetical protein